MNKKLTKLLIAVLMLVVFSAYAFADGVQKDKKNVPSNIKGSPKSALLNNNQISTWFYNNGISDNNSLGNSGFVYPRGSNKAAFYLTGFVWGGKIDGVVHVGGSTYQSGLLPGAIKNGKPEDPNAENVRIYRVRRDYRTGSLAMEIRDGEGTENQVRAQYEKDWMEWPAIDGAPYEDLNGDGKYDPSTDIPGVPGADQTIWFVNNDFDTTTVKALYGSLPMGLECQTTIWNYCVAGPLGNMIFRKYKMINKGKDNITDMYASVWSDPDLGDANDDLAGCDSTLNLGYCYNAGSIDAIYGSNPPAAGFSIVQGPVVEGNISDTALVDGHKVSGKKNLPMTSFYYLVNQSNTYADPAIGVDYLRGTLRLYNLMQGKMSTTGELFPLPPSLGPGTTKFPLSGDPVLHTGYLDGEIFPKGDRRFGISSGPFMLASGDAQEVIIAQVAAGGPGSGLNNINAITLLKNYVKAALGNSDNEVTPKPVTTSPKVKVAELDKEIILDWGSDAIQVEATEGYNNKGFTFEGYNVYQLPSPMATRSQAKRIAVYDRIDDVKYILGDVVDPETGVILKAVQQAGNDTGIKRTIKIDRDYLTNQPLENGKEYYFAVTSYSYNPDPEALISNLEDPISIIKVTPQAPAAGEKYYVNYGDTVAVTRVSGRSDGKVVALVVNPKAITGHSYQVSFNNKSVFEGTRWKVTDLTTNQIKISDQVNQTGDEAYLTVDGLLIKVFGVPLLMKSHDINDNPATPENTWGWKVLKGQLRFTWEGADGYWLEGFEGAMGAGTLWGTPLTQLKDIKLVLAATDTLGNPLNPDDPNVSYAYRYLRNAYLEAAKPEFAQFIVNKESGYPYQDFKKTLPLAAYDMEDPLNPKRLAVGFLENNVAAGLVDGKYWPPISTSANKIDNYSTTAPREWLFVFDVPYSTTPDPLLQENRLSFGELPVIISSLANRNSKSWPGGDELGIYVNHLNAENDLFNIRTDYLLTSVETEAIPTSYEMSQNYPNPFNPVTTIRYSIPEASKVELKVYDILGREVMTLVNKDQNRGSYSVQFDAGKLSSGIYIYRISAKNFTKTSKMVLLK
ncbi:MAG: T9SS type A sorting domain-containing protein [Ignavibacteria bacterium]|jgi:hypothetical protein|nr:T9SS type A sorting domain-containing protein [Ignavibacteria bacterium]MCU7502087.1 T9SS type A sorting domain-containing protein [Ignavibacteria bacterium]MCU7515489.1 T9SS type A sorting domain-containing protein [Ignavibacteria bacterium]